MGTFTPIPVPAIVLRWRKIQLTWRKRAGPKMEIVVAGPKMEEYETNLIEKVAAGSKVVEH